MCRKCVCVCRGVADGCRGVHTHAWTHTHTHTHHPTNACIRTCLHACIRSPSPPHHIGTSRTPPCTYLHCVCVCVCVCRFGGRVCMHTVGQLGVCVCVCWVFISIDLLCMPVVFHFKPNQTLHTLPSGAAGYFVQAFG